MPKPKCYANKFVTLHYLQINEKINCNISFNLCAILFFFHSHSRRKWLPPPLRKLSQGKVDKTTTVVERPLVKKGSEKTFKLASVDKLTTSVEEERTKTIPTTSASNAQNNSTSLIGSSQTVQSTSATAAELEAEEEVTFELPPPMKPMQDSQAIINNGPTVSSAIAAEQSPCKRVS